MLISNYKNIHYIKSGKKRWRAVVVRDGIFLLRKNFATDFKAAQAVAKALGVKLGSLRKIQNPDYLGNIYCGQKTKPLPPKPLLKPKPRVLRVVFGKKQKTKQRIVSGKNVGVSGDIPSQGFVESPMCENLQNRSYK